MELPGYDMESVCKQSVSSPSVSGDPAKVCRPLELLTVPDEAGENAAGWRKQSPHELGGSCKLSGEAPEPSLLQSRPEVSGRPEKFIDDSTKPSDSDAAIDGRGGIVDVICIWILVSPKESGR
jgi:hypothetical protein